MATSLAPSAAAQTPRTSAASAPFDNLLSGVLPSAYRFALHLARNPADAEDLVQDTALSACRAFAQFRPGTNFKAWFLRIMVNGFYSRCRAARREGRTGSAVWLAERHGPMGTVHPHSSDPAHAVLAALEVEHISAAIRALPDEYRTVAALSIVLDLPYREIARILGRPIGTVRSRLFRARKILRHTLILMAQDHGLGGRLIEGA
ncbi:MAG: sigma-70 family RNA polymerase sigma factor [Gemmatimonadales bacterium]